MAGHGPTPRASWRQYEPECPEQCVARVFLYRSRPVSGGQKGKATRLPHSLHGKQKCRRHSMAIQLTPGQEQRIQAAVNAGAYPSVETALNAAVSAVEVAAKATALEGS